MRLHSNAALEEVNIIGCIVRSKSVEGLAGLCGSGRFIIDKLLPSTCINEGEFRPSGKNANVIRRARRLSVLVSIPAVIFSN